MSLIAAGLPVTARAGYVFLSCFTRSCHEARVMVANGMGGISIKMCTLLFAEKTPFKSTEHSLASHSSWPSRMSASHLIVPG